MTVAQKAEAVMAEKTECDIKAVLMSFTKAEMAELYKQITGRQYNKSLAVKKDCLASDIAQAIMHDREEKAFKALSIAEKYETLLKIRHSECVRKIQFCTIEEMRTLAKLCGDTNAITPECALADYVIQEMGCRRQISRFEQSIHEYCDDEELEYRLYELSKEALRKLAVKARINTEGYTRCDLVDMLLAHYSSAMKTA